MRKCLSIFLIALWAAFPIAYPAFAAGPVIVIDPGHGGEDTGAVGPGGAEEKNVVLSLALKVAEILNERIPSTVLLTRTGDVFIPLEERTAFANRNGADLFVSIHVNAAVNREASGFETFFLSFDATDDDARRVAAFENRIVKTAEAKTDGDDIQLILLDLANTEAHHESSRLAENVHLSMLKYSGRENRGVKQAPFTVLVGATMPAILVESGFISNPAEEKLLTSKKEQGRIAEAIVDGIMGFTGTGAKAPGKDVTSIGKRTRKN
ncbi:MAG: N-acetylmuramoyl-L-alanine amidase [Deltaproteobacteria bacterium]|nr:N-acetylmuramoyl-L-alanine amidase [Deltaproteobacteria bacterium]